jgi:hypothetical protein
MSGERASKPPPLVLDIYGAEMAIALLVILSLVLAQGQGIRVDEQVLLPYWQSYTQIHGPPTHLGEKKDILMNCLADLLIVKRANELGVVRSKEFQVEWREAEGEATRRCKKESLNQDKCRRMIESIRKILLTKYVIEKEVIPNIKVQEEEIDQLVYSHRGQKKGKSLGREEAKLFLLEKKRAEALTAYVQELMKRYHVTIENNALMKLNVSP